MNFQDLMNKMRELDAPVAETTVEGCGDPMGMTPPAAENTNPPTMSVNLNAQGMDDIAELMKLITKVNPDMEKPAGNMPSLVPPGPSITPSLPPLKMLPDLDAEEPEGHSEPDADNKVDVIKIGGKEEDESAEPEDEDDDIMGHLNKELKPFDDQQAKDQEDEATDPDSDDDYQDSGYDGDHDEPYGKKSKPDPKGHLHKLLRKRLGEPEKTEASPAGFDQASTSPDPEFKDADFMLNKLAGGLNRPKTMHKHGYQQGDNPMAMNDSDLRASIRAELLTRLAEAKAK
jgi:hypothetical protein